MPKMFCMHTLADYIVPANQQETPIERDIALTLASYNIRAVAEMSNAASPTLVIGPTRA